MLWILKLKLWMSKTIILWQPDIPQDFVLDECQVNNQKYKFAGVCSSDFD